MTIVIYCVGFTYDSQTQITKIERISCIPFIAQIKPAIFQRVNEINAYIMILIYFTYPVIYTILKITTKLQIFIFGFDIFSQCGFISPKAE